MHTIDWNSIAKMLVSHIPTFEERLALVGIFVITIVAVNFAAVIHRRKLSHIKTEIRKTLATLNHTPANGATQTLVQSKIPFLSNRQLLRMTNIVLAFLTVGIIGSILFVRPFVIETIPAVGTTLTSAQQTISVEFDLPVDPSDIKFNMSPEIKGTWEFQRTVKAIPLARKAIFHPEESFYPGNPVVVYITGIQTFSKTGKFHEHAIEFKAPAIPNLQKITPEPGATNIKPDTEIVLTYDAAVGKFVDTQLEIEPAVSFKIALDKNIQTIIFDEPLTQDTHYKLKFYQTPRSYNIKTGVNIEVGDTKEIGTTDFSTVTTPGITSYEPKGENVKVDSIITIVFDQEMDRDSVNRHFSIIPDIPGKILWQGQDTFIFTPDRPLQKGTSYTITFSKGINSLTEGTTNDDSIVSFATVGIVKVASFNPISEAYGVDPLTANISITFDQAVDQTSAQKHFSITPGIASTYVWSGNTMTFMSSGKLDYSTRYTVTVTPGVTSIEGLDSTETFSSAFTTRSNTFALDVPLYLQAPGFTCNLVATKMVLKYRGVSVDIESIKQSIGLGGDPNTSWVDGYGTHWGPISQYIGTYRQATAKQGWTLPEILREVQKGNPVILFWYNRYSQPPGAYTLPSGATAYMGMHSEVVRGFVGSPDNPSAILVNDPWRGQHSYTPQLFMSTWGYIGYAAVVVY